MLDKQHTPPETLLRAWRIARRNGLRYVYTGNIHHKATGSTYCHGCGSVLIGRDWHELSDWTLAADGRCGHCGMACAGVFEATRGHWGRKRGRREGWRGGKGG